VPVSLDSPARTPPSVLLIEEYTALAAALISAFKKFAPKHRTRVAESLGEAETIADEIQPQLFVLDFDPPHTNAVEFLNRMSTAHPDARVLVITSALRLSSVPSVPDETLFIL
jgi:response regulator of citrate/malate metabolism